MTRLIVPSHRASSSRRPTSRRGVALYIVMIFVVAIAVMALTAIVTSGNATLVAKSYARENDLSYAAEAALAIGKSRINFDAGALPDTGYKVLMQNVQLKGADDAIINGVTVTVYAGPSGSTSGQFGRFASVVAEARDVQGNGFIRRLELSQESFAKYAYWSDDENSNGTIYFGGGDQLWGPVWSNDVISIAASGATFNDDVATAKTISGKSNGTFRKGSKENQKKINLPSTTSLAAKLLPLATAAGFTFNAPTTGDASTARMRVEFVAVDLNGNGDSSGVDEGFFRVYSGGSSDWTRADLPVSPTASSVKQCGDWHPVVSGGQLKFFPASVHNTTWFKNLMVAAGMTNTAATNEQGASLATIMGHSNARCYLGGDPHLVAVERSAGLGYATAAIQKGGDDTTFTPTDVEGAWQLYNVSPDANVQARRPWDAQYLFPIHRTLNTGAKGVIHVTGTVGVSGVLSGKISLYSTHTAVILDDLRYANDPGKGVCQDILGILAAKDVVVADNAINTPQNVSSNSTANWKVMDDTKDLYLHGVMMALNKSFTVEDYDNSPSSATNCEGTANGRGCLYLTGGLIQVSRGPVGLLSGAGYIKRYSYDRCAIVNPPPYFPTTGRFTDNRYYELDPVGFNATNLYKAITPDK